MTNTAAPQSKRIALVVGVNEAPNARASSLLYAESDAQAVAETLTRPECNVTLYRPSLLGENATSHTIKQLLLDLLEELQQDDMLLFYFSGHGQPVTIEAERRDVYLVTYDFNEKHVRRDENSHLSLRWLHDKVLSGTDVGKVLLLLDCCYPAIGDASPDPYFEELQQRIAYYLNIQRTNTPAKTGSARVSLTATFPNAVARENKDKRRGYFTDALLGGLHGGAVEDDGHVTVQHLHSYLKSHMPANQVPGWYGFDHSPRFSLAYSQDWSDEAREQRTAAARQQQQAADRRDRLLALFADHRSFMQDRLESFVGRVDELAKIRQRIAAQQPSGGYVTITGQAGQGKSSIIAKLVDAYGPDTVAHHFIPFSPGPDHQVSLLRNIMARLILKYDLLDMYVASESRAALRDFFPRVLRELAAKGGQEIIFIDGLDQIESELTGERDLSFLPTDPPSGVVFVLGTRPDDTLKPLELLKPRYEYRLPNLSRADFDLVLAHRGITLAPGLADRFYDTMQRNALYLDLVAKELREAGAADPETMITQLADNPDNLFSLSMHRLKRNATQWRTVIKPLLGVLLASRQPLSERSLRAIIGTIDADDLRDGLRCLGGLLARDGNDHVYLFHLKLHDFLRQNEAQPDKEYIFATDEEQSYHARLANWCASGNGGLAAIWDDHKQNAAEHERRTYARQHYISHLYEAHDWEHLFAVLDDGAYGKAKVCWDPSTRSYAKDLDLGRKAAAWHGWTLDEGIAQLPHLWRYSLLRCTLASRADSYPEELFEAMVLVGWEQRAIATAELLTDPEKKASVLCRIGKILLNRRASEANQILTLSLAVSRNLSNPMSRVKALLDIAKVFINSGNDTAAMPLVQESYNETKLIEQIFIQSEYLKQIVTILAQMGYFNDAIDKARAIGHTLLKSETLIMIATILAKKEPNKKEEITILMEESLNYINSIEEKNLDLMYIRAKRTKSMAQIINMILVDKKEINEVLAFLQMTDSNPQQTLVLLLNSITLLARFGTAEQANLLLKKVLQLPQTLDNIFIWIMLLRAVCTDVIDEWISEQPDQIDTLFDSDTVQILINSLDNYNNALDKSNLQQYGQIETLFDNNKLLGLIELLGKDNWSYDTFIMNSSSMLSSLINSANQYQKQFVQNIVMPMDIKNVPQLMLISISNQLRVNVYKSIAKLLVQLKRFDKALEVLHNIPQNWHKVDALVHLAYKLDQIGEHYQISPLINEALQVVNIPRRDMPLANALVSIAGILYQIGKQEMSIIVADNALKIFQNLGIDYLTRVTPLFDIEKILVKPYHLDLNRILNNLLVELPTNLSGSEAKAFAFTGRIDDALLSIDNIKDVKERVRTLNSICKEMIFFEAGKQEVNILLNESLNNIRSMERDWEQVRYLAIVATLFYQIDRKDQTVILIDEVLSITDILKNRNQVFSDKDIFKANISITQLLQGGIQSNIEQNYSIITIVKALSQIERFDECQEIVDSIEDKLVKAAALSIITGYLIQKGKTNNTNISLNVVLKLIRELLNKQEAYKIFEENINKDEQAFQDVLFNTMQRMSIFLDIFFLTPVIEVLVLSGHFDEVHQITSLITVENLRSGLLVAMSKVLKKANKLDQLLKTTQNSWSEAITREYLLDLLDMALPLVQHTPALGVALAEGFAWVNRQVSPEG